MINPSYISIIDDGLIAAENQETANELLEELKKEFELTYNNDVSVFLGFQIERMQNGSFFLHQAAYAESVVERFRMTSANPVSIPAEPHQETYSEIHSINDEEGIRAPYREAIGSLMYLATGTRPDIAFAVNRASRYMEKPTKVQWNGVKRIIKYLKGTLNYGLKFEKYHDSNRKAFSDSDYAGELETRRSTTGYLIQWGSSVITWGSQRQTVVALSTTDAEYMAACQTVKEIMWIKKLIEELCQLDQHCITLYMDNQSAIQLIKNPVFHERTKHIDIRFHYIRERFQEKIFSLKYINTKDQTADILTKPLARQLFHQHRSVLCFDRLLE